MPRIDSDLVWKQAADIGGDELTSVVAGLIGQRPGSPIDPERITATQVLSLQSLLRLTAEEMVNRHRISVDTLRRVIHHAQMLHAVLARYGALTGAEIISAFGWYKGDLDAAVDMLQGQLSQTGQHLVRRQQVLSLEEVDDLLPRHLANRLQRRGHDRLAPLEAKEAGLVVAALRSLTHRSAPGIDLPADALTALTRRGIAQPHDATFTRAQAPPEDDSSHPAAPFTLHPDVVFAFALALPAPAAADASDRLADHPPTCDAEPEAD